LMLLVAVAVVPFQAAAEEYAFRGLLMQVIGSWLRHPAFAILLPVPLFVLGHGYGLVGQIDVAICRWPTCRFPSPSCWPTHCWCSAGSRPPVPIRVTRPPVPLRQAERYFASA
ncbi:MAG: family intrarane metalloprotease protein, partial [Arthrobacter koreensis]|uniref:CPBP family intramembrane glutamic endopeptidase n=1 Tax=Arthrobacter koreensis TaxID=199136 RepID=UPI0024096089